MRCLLSIMTAFLLLTPPGSATADTGAVLAEIVQKLTRGSPWKLTTSVPINFPTHHPQGMVKIGDTLFVSSVEIKTRTKRFPQITDGYDRDTGEGVGHLFKIDMKGNLISDLVLGEGTMYHPTAVLSSTGLIPRP
jgi:hypothetical protein